MKLPVEVRRSLAQYHKSRRYAEEHQARAQAESARIAKVLTERLGMSVRDVADLLGLSHQRVHQFGGHDQGE